MKQQPRGRRQDCQRRQRGIGHQSTRRGKVVPIGGAAGEHVGQDDGEIGPGPRREDDRGEDEDGAGGQEAEDAPATPGRESRKGKSRNDLDESTAGQGHTGRALSGDQGERQQQGERPFDVALEQSGPNRQKHRERKPDRDRAIQSVPGTARPARNPPGRCERRHLHAEPNQLGGPERHPREGDHQLGQQRWVAEGAKSLRREWARQHGRRVRRMPDRDLPRRQPVGAEVDAELRVRTGRGAHDRATEQQPEDAQRHDRVHAAAMTVVQERGEARPPGAGRCAGDTPRRGPLLR